MYNLSPKAQALIMIVLNLMVVAAFIAGGLILWIASEPTPVVAVDHIDKSCVWIEEAPEFERRECPDELPSKYQQIYVQGAVR